MSSEVYRVLKPDGIFGDNEVTYVKPPPAQLRPLASKLAGTDLPRYYKRMNDGLSMKKLDLKLYIRLFTHYVQLIL